MEEMISTGESERNHVRNDSLWLHYSADIRRLSRKATFSYSSKKAERFANLRCIFAFAMPHLNVDPFMRLRLILFAHEYRVLRRVY
jgi:hypothetical protein